MPVRMSSSPICASCGRPTPLKFCGRGGIAADAQHEPRTLAKVPCRQPEFNPTAGIASSSAADRVRHALLGEARLGSASELPIRSRRIARLLRVRFALLHEAVEGRAGELLLGGLRLASCILRKGITANATCKRNHQSDQYDHSHDIPLLLLDLHTLTQRCNMIVWSLFGTLRAHTATKKHEPK